MSRFNFNNNAFQKYLFLLGGIAFGLSLLKNIFLEQNPGIIFYLMELLSFIFFLAAFFVSDKNNQQLRSVNDIQKNKYEEERKWMNQKIDKLQEIVTAYEKKENEATRFASYQEKVLQQLTNIKDSGKNKHKLLYSLGELFHGMAVILYKKEEPGGRFNVEASYGLAEDAPVAGFISGEGLHGQAVVDGVAVVVGDIPESYIEVETALGKSDNYYLYLLPVMKENECNRLLEILTFKESRIKEMWPEVMENLVKRGIF
ncbi:GAF domain-containing protein [Marinilabilia sp.]|uniref:GAF domain-containing protein n=1 Tax=Marinilabilia sp. TaxID=2021252 RepID=UPI0025BB0D6C|nr:GAF domain-containing protein [Marinilabilia sp.]